MKPLDLTPRLAAVAAQVPPGALADVGTDHAYLLCGFCWPGAL